MELSTPTLRHFCDLTIELDPIREMGQGRAGKRRIIPIIGGTVEGPEIKGKLLNLGADWQTIFEDGLAELDARYAFETDDGALIEIINYGFRHGPPEVLQAIAAGEDVDPSTYYMRTQARMETGDDRYKWLNGMMFVGTGARLAQQVKLALYVVE